MTDRHDGGPAFPVSDIVQRDEKGGHYGAPVSSTGMTLHDAATIAAMQGILAGMWANSDIGGVTPQMVIETAREHADAMLAARSEAKP